MTHINRKNFILTAILLGALVASGWLARQSFLNLDDTNPSQPTTPDAFMTEVNYTHYNTQGDFRCRIYAPKVIHFPEQDTATFTNPKMVALTENQLTWVITADRGISHQGMKVLDLYDHVVVQRLNAAKQKTLTMTTTQLTAFPQQRFARTDQPVTIIQPGSVVNSVGLTADLNKGEIQLLSQVQGTYEKQTP